MKKLSIIIGLAVAVPLATGASAQEFSLTNGVSATIGVNPLISSDAYSMDLGSAGTTGWVTQMPLSLSYGSVSANISFTGDSGVYYGTTAGYSAAPVDSNYLRAAQGSVTLDFSQAMSQFSMRWGTQGTSDSVAFYRNGELVASLGGSEARSASISLTGSSTTYTSFAFSEVQYDRVVLNSSSIMEAGDLRFAAAPEVAPLPLGSAGGLIAFLGMMGARRRGLSWRDAMREANPLRKMREARAA